MGAAWPLAFGAAIVVAAEFVVIGLVPAMTTDLALSPGQTGSLVVVFALASALLGPVLAETEQGARSLLLALLAGGSGPVRIDVPLQHVELRRWLVGLGLAEVSQRVEMVRGAKSAPWQVRQRFALATQAWG